MARKTVTFGDKDIFVDMLSSTKQLSHIYGTLLQEASNAELLKKIKSLSTEIANEQRMLFNYIYSKGWYELEAEDKSKISKANRKFAKNKSEMN